MTRYIATGESCSRKTHGLIGAAVAAAISGSFTMNVYAAEQSAPAAQTEPPAIEEVQVTGSRIVRKDLQSNSPLITVGREKLEDNTYISIEQTLNELPQFMAGGAGLGAFGSQTGVGSLGGMEQLDGGAGTGTMFDNARLPDTGGRIGTYTPGAANVNLRGLGSNRSLTLINGHRGQPTNATGTVDLNTIPSAAISSIEVITGGASAVYGADALAGVTNIKLRDNFEGMEVRARGGIYEEGDGAEYQVSTLMGTSIAGKGHAMVGIEYSKREVSYYANRSWYREALESPYSNFLNAAFQPYTYYSAPGGNTPTAAAVGSIFPGASLSGCTNASGTKVPCVGTTGGGGGFFFNDDGSLFTRSSSCYLPTATTTTCGTAPGGAAPGSTQYFGPQHYKGVTTNSRDNPNEITCQWAANQPNSVYTDRSCNPTLTSSDWDRWLGGPREAYTLFGDAHFDFTDSLRAFTTIGFSNSTTSTRREASPASGGFAANVPFGTSAGGGGATYLPSIQQTDVVRNGVVVRHAGDTLPEYQAGGTRGTTCAATGGCTMAQAFPVPAELRTLLESRVAGTRAGGGTAATNPFAGLSSCVNYTRMTNPNGTGAATGQLTSTNGVASSYAIDPNTGQPVYTCGPNSTWALNTRFDMIPPRGTINTQRTWSLAAGLEGDLGLSDWTWELYLSKGQGQTNTEFQGFVSMYNYRLIMSQPNYGMGYTLDGGSAKYLSCTSGLNPFDNIATSQDCIDAVSSNQFDRSGTDQTIYEISSQGGLFELPGGEVRAAIGATYRENSYFYTPDSLRERDYVNDTSAGQFGIGSIDSAMNVKEIYAELLVPLLHDLPGVRSLELELGGRMSKYSTGEKVPTWKALLSWQPVDWLRARGGYNRAERAPNLAELYTAASANASGAGTDPCIVPSATTINNITSGRDTTTPLAVLNDPINPNQDKLQALCAAQIQAAGGSGNSEFDADPDNFGRSTFYSSGITIVNGNPDLKSEKGQTWTVGLVFNSPWSNPLARRLSTTLDWYEARIDDPIEIPPGGIVSYGCFNAYGDNPDYVLDDPDGYCANIARDPTVGNIRFTDTPYMNRGKLVMRGLDVSMNWSAALGDMGLGDAPGSLSLSIAGNFLFDQIQAVQAGGNTRDYAGIGGATPFRSSTNLGYNWGPNRVSVNWQYRSGTCIAVFGASGCDTNRSRYPVTNTFTVTGGTRIGIVNASLSISNPLDTKPRSGTHLWTDPTEGYGTFNPFDDITGRRFSLNLSASF